MRLKLLLAFCALGFVMMGMTGCKTNSSQGLPPLKLEQMMEKLAEIEEILETAEIGETDNTYPQWAADDLSAAWEELMTGVSKAKGGMLFMQYEVDNYVINADKAIAAFRNSLQLILDPGTPAELVVYGIDKKGYIDFGSSQHYGAGTQWTIETWVKYDQGFFEFAIGDLVSTFFSRKDNYIEGWMINFMGSGLRTTIGMGPQLGRVFEWSGNYPTNYGQWNHIVAVYDQSASSKQLKMYLNGNLLWEKDNDIRDEGGVTQSYTPNADDLRMWAFARPSNPDCCVTGYIKKFRKWSSAKTLEEVKALMNSDVDGTEAGLVFAWDLTEMPDDIENIPDKTGQFSAKIVGSHKWIEVK